MKAEADFSRRHNLGRTNENGGWEFIRYQATDRAVGTCQARIGGCVDFQPLIDGEVREMNQHLTRGESWVALSLGKAARTEEAPGLFEIVFVSHTGYRKPHPPVGVHLRK
jgi:hypothetical protein